jgi:hypothetical protein
MTAARCEFCDALLQAAWAVSHAPTCDRPDPDPLTPQQPPEDRGGPT